MAFSELLYGRDAESGAALPGFESSSRVVSTTDRVRIKGVVDRTRVVVVEVSEKDNVQDSKANATEDGEDDEDDEEEDYLGDYAEDDVEEVANGRWEMEIARVYEKTLMALGEDIGATMADG